MLTCRDTAKIERLLPPREPPWIATGPVSFRLDVFAVLPPAASDEQRRIKPPRLTTWPRSRNVLRGARRGVRTNSRMLFCRMSFVRMQKFEGHFVEMSFYRMSISRMQKCECQKVECQKCECEKVEMLFRRMLLCRMSKGRNAFLPKCHFVEM